MELVSESKVCTKCLLEKPLSDFWISDKKRGSRRGPCKECDKAYQRMQYERSPEFREKAYANSRKQALAHPRTAEKSREYSIKSKFGLSGAEYQTMAASQGHKCALCGTSEVGRYGKEAKWKAGHWMIDHCHETGRIRGLLCHKCNVRIGAYEGLKKEIGFAVVEAYLNETGALPSPCRDP